VQLAWLKPSLASVTVSVVGLCRGWIDVVPDACSKDKRMPAWLLCAQHCMQLEAPRLVADAAALLGLLRHWFRVDPLDQRY
jgi:hypothetical protein